MRALHTAATGMMAQELNVQVISNNIANMRTTGYKRQRAEFQDLLYEHVSRVGTQTTTQGNILPVGIDLGGGVKTVGTPTRDDARHDQPHGNDFDVAIRGEGMFKIQMPDGTFAYTRDGSFQMDAQGRIVTPKGNVVQPGLTVPPNSTSITISPQGQVSATLPAPRHRPCSASSPSPARQQGRLQPMGDNLFVETPASGRRRTVAPTPTATVDLLQGSLEQANVEAVTEISDLIAAQRAYEMTPR